MDSLTPDLPRQLLSDLCRLVRERAASEADIQAGFIAGKEAADILHQESQNSLESRFKAEKDVTEAEYAAAKKQILAHFEAESSRLQNEYDAVHEQIIARFEGTRKTLERQMTESRWEIMAMAEAARSGSNLQLKEIIEGLDSRWQALQEIHREAMELLHRRGQWRDFPEPQLEGLLLETDPAQRFNRALDLARTQYKAMTRQFMSRFFPRFFQGLWPLGIFLLLWAATVYPAALWLGWSDWRWAPVSCGAAFIIFMIIGIWLHRVVKRQGANAYLKLLRMLLEAGINRPAVLETTKAQCQQQFGDIINRQNAEMKKAEEKYVAAMAEIERRKEHDLQQAEALFPPRLAEIAALRDRALPEADEKYTRRLRELEMRFAAESERLRSGHELAIRENDDRCRREWTNMSQRWLSGMEGFRARWSGWAASAATCSRIGTHRIGAAGLCRLRFRRPSSLDPANWNWPESRTGSRLMKGCGCSKPSLICRCFCPFPSIRCCSGRPTEQGWPGRWIRCRRSCCECSRPCRRARCDSR